MPTSRIRFLATLALSWALVFTPAYAHEAWAERVILIHYGEPGETLDAYKPSQIRDLSAIGADGAAVAVTAKAVGDQAVVVTPQAGEPLAVFFTMDLSHYVITGDDWKEATADEAAKAAKSWVGSYTATSILAWHASLTQPRNRALELVPQVDPSTVKVGEPLPLRALRNGKPLAGLTIELGEGLKPVVSDAAGNLSVPVKSGHQIILGSLDEVNGGHTIGHMAVLSFSHR